MSIAVDINDLNNDAYFRGVDAGIQIEKERITNWVKENRSAIELEAGIYVYRDHFDSQSLIKFILGETE